MTFLTDYLNGTASAEQIHDYIELWSDGEEGLDQELHEYLGLTWNEYSAWAIQPSRLAEIVGLDKERT